MSYDPNLTPVDFILLSDQRSPGVATIEGAGIPLKWDEQNGYGFSGAFAIFRGLKISNFTVKLRLDAEQDWIEWDTWRPLVARPPFGRRPTARDIWHPWLEMLEIRSVVTEFVGQPEDQDDGSFVIPIKFKAWRPPKLSLAKPKSSEPKQSTDPVDQLIERLTGQVQELAE